MYLFGATDGGEVDVLLHGLVVGAMDADFEPTMTDDLRQLVLDYSDVFRVWLGHDKADHEQPLEVHIEDGALPYRSGVRRYPDSQRQFVQEYVRELESAGLVKRNTHSRWVCPAPPVTKRGTDEFRITIDYKLVNRLTAPLAGASSNLAVVTESVLGSRVGTFDSLKGFCQMPL